MGTYRNVKAQIAKLEKQASDLLKKESAVVIEKVRGLIAEYGLTAEHLGLTSQSRGAVKATRKKSAAAKPAGIPLYADPVSGKTWTGKGKQPNFILEGLAKGKSKDDYLIAKKATAPVAKVKVASPVKSAKAAKKAPVARKLVKKVVAKTAAKKDAAKAAVVKAPVATT